MNRRPDEFRVIYVGVPTVVHCLREDFLRAGAKSLNPDDPNALTVGPALAKRIGQLRAGEKQGYVGATVFFRSDVIAVAQILPGLDPDLVIVDERLSTPQSRKRQEAAAAVSAEPGAYTEGILERVDPRDEVAQRSQLGQSLPPDPADETEILPVTFEKLRHAFNKFTPREFHYPSRRILVVLSQAEHTQDRLFQLGLSNVRGVMIEPSRSVELFLFATKQLHEFRSNQTKSSICISGGGLEGYIYAVGVVQALDDCFLEKDCTDFDIFCGVSSGAILASCLAGGIQTGDVVKQLYKRQGRLEPLSISVIFDVAGAEIVRRIIGVLRSVSTLDPAEVVIRLQRLVPVGFFKGEKLKAFIERQLSRMGITDNISALKKELYISATDQDTGEHVVFGMEPWKDIRISQAVRASTALPPFFLPERINGHWFTDGQLTSSSDFNTAIRLGAGLVVLIDPMVAYSSNSPGAVIKYGGYFTAVQAIKSLVQSRATSMLKHSMDLNPDVDFVVIQPTDEVMEAMAGNPMRYRIRTELAELGYKGTLGQILQNYDSLAHKFAKAGFEIKSRDEIEALLR